MFHWALSLRIVWLQVTENPNCNFLEVGIHCLTKWRVKVFCPLKLVQEVSFTTNHTDFFPRLSSTLSVSSFTPQGPLGVSHRTPVPTFWEGSPFMTANTLGFVITPEFLPKYLLQKKCSFPAIPPWVVRAKETACPYLSESLWTSVYGREMGH